jgi:hypothetical protein
MIEGTHEPNPAKRRDRMKETYSLSWVMHAAQMLQTSTLKVHQKRTEQRPILLARGTMTNGPITAADSAAEI